jgi:hypothetical protein
MLRDSFADDGECARELFLLPLKCGAWWGGMWRSGLQRSSAVTRYERTL